jgi:hypothetical protein
MASIEGRARRSRAQWQALIGRDDGRASSEDAL